MVVLFKAINLTVFLLKELLQVNHMEVLISRLVFFFFFKKVSIKEKRDIPSCVLDEMAYPIVHRIFCSVL
jgi:hypothetical protein